ncbi:MAG: UvrD-helicase domain-containing protein [Magnetococcales bacterium]|nr:UvrD-helicase domain-containing protein [Magnetococcales bacterium]
MTVHSLIDDLNTPQHEAVTTTDGFLMVLAGAGSGKTRVLTRRLAWLLANEVCRPEEILAVTFTNKAAREMRERVAEMLGMDPTGSMSRFWIGTFHSMGARILRQHADRLGYDSNFVILDTGDQERLVKNLVAESGGFARNNHWTPRRLVQTISRWKDDGVGPDQITEKHVLFPKDRVRLAEIYRGYQEALKRTNSMDFGDLLLNCLMLWRDNEDLLDLYRNRFRYLLVDEYQDTNKVQYQWMKWLATGHRNLCVVGDDDQSIYSWRGARLDNILNFSDDFPDTKVIRLEQNYRSTGNILRAAASVISNNDGRMDKTLWTEGEPGEPLVLYSAQSAEDEAEFVATEINSRASVGDYTPFSILVRTSRQTRLFEEALGIHRIPFQVVGGLRFMERAEVKDALAYLRMTASNRDDLAFERIINQPRRGLGPTTIERLRDLSVQTGLPLLEAARLATAQPEHQKMMRPAARNSLIRFITLIDQTRQTLEQSGPRAALDYLLVHSGYLESLESSDRGDDQRENLQELAAKLSQYSSLTAFLEEAALVSDMAGSNQTESEQGPITNFVTISTLHAAKGLEFPVVFLVGVEEEMLPHKMAMKDGEHALEEERRLAYVGMTRAREKLYLTCARQRFLFRERVRPLPSRFIAEIPKEIIENKGIGTRHRRGVGGGRGGRTTAYSWRKR